VSRQRDPQQDGLVQGLIGMFLLLIAVTFLGFAVYFAADAATAPARAQELAVRRAARYGLARLRGAAAPRLRFRELVLCPGFLLAPLATRFGFFFPDVFLTFKIRARREAIRAQLPDALDLLAVSVEAGLGFDGAVTKLTEHMEGPLVDEFALTLGEIRIGES